MNEKKLRKSPIVIVLYVVAALLLVYSCYLIYSTVQYINSYYSAYGMSAGVGETITYVLQTVYQPLAMVFILFASGNILNEVRALNPAYYATAEEIAQAKTMKAASKVDKKAAAETAQTADDTVVFVNEEKEEAVETEEAAEAAEAAVETEEVAEAAEEAEEITEEAVEETVESEEAAEAAEEAEEITEESAEEAAKAEENAE